jgi:hypothetical protein
MSPSWCDVTLDFTDAVIRHDTLLIDMNMRGGSLTLVVGPGITVDADALTVRYADVEIDTGTEAGGAVTLRVQLAGRLRYGWIGTRRVQAGSEGLRFSGHRGPRPRWTAVNAVDSGLVADPGHHGAPNQPRSPDPPQSAVGWAPRLRAHASRNAWNRAAGAFRRRGVRTFLIGLPLAAVCLAGLTAACSGHDPARGVLTGHLYGVGGPPPGLPRAWPGTVTVTGPGVHRDVPVGAGGIYSVTVPAGKYAVAGRSPLYESGTGSCRAARTATVTSGHSTKADVLCQMR